MSKVTINEMVEKYEDLRKVMIQEVKANFTSYFEEVFNAFPNLESFTFVGYVCFFADGDPVYYSVRDYQFDIEMINGRTGSIGECSDDYEDLDLSEKEASQLFKLLNANLSSIPSYLIQDCFGDDSKITVHRDGSVDSEHYGNHD